MRIDLNEKEIPYIKQTPKPFKETNLEFTRNMREFYYKIPSSGYVNYVNRLTNDPFAYSIYERTHFQDKNFLALFVGDTGIGKSLSAVTLSEEIDIGINGMPRFFIYCDEKGNPDPLSRVVYDINAFIRLTTQSNLPAGSMIVWDETGIEGDSTQFYTAKARVLKYILQTFRFMNLGVIMTCPDVESVMIGARRLIHYFIDIQERKPDHTIAEVWKIKRNRVRVGKKMEWFPYHPRVWDEYNKELKIIKRYNIPKPFNPMLEKYYNKVKQYVMNDWYSHYDERMQQTEQVIKEFRIPGLDDLVESEKKFSSERRMAIPELYDYIKASKDKYYEPKKMKYDLATISVDLARCKKGYGTKDLQNVVSALNKEEQK
jgi:hypothetical protein